MSQTGRGWKVRGEAVDRDYLAEDELLEDLEEIKVPPGKKSLAGEIPVPPGRVHRKARSGGAVDLAAAKVALAQAVQSSGHKLPNDLIDEFGAALETDLEQVQVHTDWAAAEAAEALGARAFTIGTNIFFGAGEYDPDSDEGKRLIAHEVAHTLQRRAGAADELEISSPSDASERDADAFAEDISLRMSLAGFELTADAAQVRRQLERAEKVYGIEHVASLWLEHRDRAPWKIRTVTDAALKERANEAKPAPAEQRRERASARAAVDAALGRVGVQIPIEHRDRLATYYGEGISLATWALRADNPAAQTLLDRMLAHCDHHAGCGHVPERPPLTSERPDEDRALDRKTRRAIERTTGRSLGDVVVREDASLANRGRLGEAVGKVIRLAPDLPGPDTELGSRVRLHEAAHVAQQSAPSSAAVGGNSRAEVEADAHAVADAAARGEVRETKARASTSEAYGFDVGDVVGAAADALGIDPMSWLRQFAPQMASVVDNGFGPILEQIGTAAAGALEPVLAAIDPAQLAEQFTEWVSEMQTSNLAFGVLTGCCECLGDALGDALATVQGALASPRAEQIREWLSGVQDDGTSLLGDLLESAMDGVGGIIDTLLGWYESARETLGPAIQEVWEYVADGLGLDKSLSPAAAIRKKIGELWDELMEELEPIRRALEDAWQFLCDETFIGDIVSFIEDCQKLVRAIQLCQDSRSRDPDVWLGIMAEQMQGTVFEGLIADLQSGWTTAERVGTAVSQWVVRLLQKLGIIEAWNSAAPAIARIGQAIQRFVAQVKVVLQAIETAISAAMTKIGEAFVAIYEAIRPLLNFVVGLGVAMSALSTGNPLPMMLFFAGNLWLYVVPDCYKEALANFVLDIFISVMEWLPASFPMVVFLRAAALGFLRTLRGASPDQKITAMDMIARCWAGDFELMAGLVVGFFKGLWNSTPGLIIQLALFQWTIPFRAMWAAMETLGSLIGQTGSALANMGEFVVDLMSRAQTVETDQQGNVNQGPFADEEQAPGETTDEVEILPPDIIEGPPAEDEEAGDVVSPNPDEDGPAPGQDEENQEGGTDDTIDDPVWEPLPPLEDLGAFAETLQNLRDGVDRASIDRFLAQFNLTMDTMGTEAGKAAGEAFIGAMTARGTPYRIGELVGTVVGFITGEVLINLIPVGGQIGSAVAKIPQIAKVAITALRSFPLFMRALRALRAIVAPAMRLLLQFGDEIARIGRAIMKWFDDLVKWARAQLDNLMEWVGRNFPKLKRLLRRGLRRLLGGDELDEAAEEAADEAWERLVRQMGDAVYTQAQIQGMLNGIRVRHPRDIRIQLRMVAHRSSWEIRATASKGSSRKTADSGRGWVVSAHDTGTPYYAPESDWWNHHRVLDRAADDIMDWEPRDHGAPFEQRYAQLREKVQTEQTQGQDRLRMRGIQFQFEMESQSSVERDDECTITLILTPNARQKVVRKPAPHLSQYLGARRVGNTFEGSFDDPNWNWNGYNTGGNLTRHPVNKWTAGGYQHDITQMPELHGNYRYGGRTRGWRAGTWRTYINRQVRTYMNEQNMDQDAARAQVIADEATRTGITVADWDTLYLTGWQGHHIHEVSWGGPHTIGNIVYLIHAEHHPYSTWWNNRRDDIKDNLGIPR